jgi:enoyl-CoA hydratase
VERETEHNPFHQMCERLRTMPKATICVLAGRVGGGGSELAASCDMRFGVLGKTVVNQMEVPIGILPGGTGTQRLPRRIGAGRAMELILTGDLINAEEAYRLGLVNRIIPGAELLAETRKTADKIASKGPLAIAYARRAVRKAAELNLPAGNDLEAELFALLFASNDQKEGMRAFLAKRPAKFEGK